LGGKDDGGFLKQIIEHADGYTRKAAQSAISRLEARLDVNTE
jgi:hypothetical protein